MSDNLDDDDLNLDESFDDFEKKGNSLGDLWRENAMFKVGAIAGAVILLFVLISVFGGGDEEVDPSYIGATPDIAATPGTEEASPAYIQAIEETNEAAIEEAFNTGGSALPVPIEPPVGVVTLPEDGDDAEDPLQRWRRLQEERLQREIRQREAVVPDDSMDTALQAEQSAAVQALADLMAEQMSSILESKADLVRGSAQFTDRGFLELLQEQKELEQGEGALEDGETLEEGEFGEEFAEELLMPAGEIVYAQLITEANTDTPGPILAEIMSGPLKGSRLLGTFEEQSELITLNFDTVVYEDQSLTVDAVALDPATTLPGLATEVDHRYFKRIILPAAAAFVEGMAGAIAESGLTTVTVEGDTVAEETEDTDTEQEVSAGIEEAGQKLGEILDDMASDTKVLVRIHAGTPIGVLFLEPVTTDEDTAVTLNEDTEG